MAITPQQRSNLIRARQAATDAGHPFPGAAAAEAALESWDEQGGWFSSYSAVRYNNLLGIKKPSWWTGAVFRRPAIEEQPSGEVYRIPDAIWTAFDSWKDCFACQLHIQHRNSAYAPVLDCKTPETYISCVSRIWSTGSKRGRDVMQIYLAHLDVLGPHTLETT